jgi:hypothetical protein
VEGAQAGLATRGESFGWQAIRPELSIGVHGRPWTSGSASRIPNNSQPRVGRRRTWLSASGLPPWAAGVLLGVLGELGVSMPHGSHATCNSPSPGLLPTTHRRRGQPEDEAAHATRPWCLERATGSRRLAAQPPGTNAAPSPGAIERRCVQTGDSATCRLRPERTNHRSAGRTAM